jgi:hypothetical protein
MNGRPLALTVAALVAVIFGLMTIVSGWRALFGGVDMGAVVPFVLRFNFAAGFAYMLAGAGLWRGAPWAPALSTGIALATAAVFAAFLWHVWQGEAYETRTMGAMILRAGIWTAIAAAAIRNRWRGCSGNSVRGVGLRLTIVMTVAAGTGRRIKLRFHGIL